MRGLTGIVVSGVPTETDVKLLLDAFPPADIAVNALLTYEDVERVLKLKRSAPRWKTVTTAWRRRVLREHNFRLVTVTGQGFKRLTEQDRSLTDTKEWLDKQRGAMRRVEDLRRTDTREFSAEELRAHTHRTAVLTRTAETIRGSAREIVPPATPKALPKMTMAGGLK